MTTKTKQFFAKRFILATSLAMPLLVVPTASFAHDKTLINNQCDVELNNNLTITNDHILVKKNDTTVYDIFTDSNNNHMIFYRGDAVKLSTEQQHLVDEIAVKTRAIVPAITTIALEAVAVAFDGISAGLGGLGENDKLNNKLSDIKSRLQSKIADNKNAYSFEEGDFNMNFADKEIDAAIEEIVSSALPQMVGGFLQLIGNAIANGDEGLENLDNLEENIEKEIEARASGIETKAKALCKQIKYLDNMETILKQSGGQFKQFDIINVKRSNV